MLELSTNPQRYRPALGKPLHLVLRKTQEIIEKSTPGAPSLELPREYWWERYPINNTFQIISEYYKRAGKEKLARRAYTLSEHARPIDILLTTPEGQEILPTIQEHSQQINSIEDIFRFITSHPKAKEIVEAFFPHTRAPFTSLATSLAILSGIHDLKKLYFVSRYSNYFDILYRTGLLPSIRERSAQIRSIQDIFKFITHPETHIERIAEETDAPFTSLATSLAILSGHHNLSILQTIARYSNHLDKLHRTGLLPLIQEYSQQISSHEDIFKLITHPEIIKNIITRLAEETDAPFQTLATSLALLRGIHDPKKLQTVSLYSNVFDQLLRINPELYEYVIQNIKHVQLGNKNFIESKRSGKRLRPSTLFGYIANLLSFFKKDPEGSLEIFAKLKETLETEATTPEDINRILKKLLPFNEKNRGLLKYFCGNDIDCHREVLDIILRSTNIEEIKKIRSRRRRRT